MKKKYSFLLLELLIAISILSIALPILINFPSYIFKKNLEIVTNIEMERVSRVIYSKLIQELDFSNLKPMSELSRLPLENISSNFDNGIIINYTAHYKLGFTKAEDAELRSGDHYRVLTVHIYLASKNLKKTFTYKKLLTK